MSRLGCMALCLAFLLGMNISRSLAMDDPGNRMVRIPGSNEWIPASQFFPVEKKARYDFTPLREEPSSHQPVEAGEAQAWNKPPNSRTSGSNPTMPDSFPKTHDGRPLSYQWPRELRARQDASHAAGPSRSRGGPVVQENPNGLLGSLKPDKSKFRNVEYPLDSPELAHLYGDDGSRPANFAQLSQGASEDGRTIFLEVNPVKFYPEPNILNRLQRAIVDKLQELEIPLGEHDGSNHRFLNGRFLLPPLEQTGNGLKMPENALHRLSGIPSHRLLRDSATKPAYIYKLVLPKEGDEEEARYILATTASPGVHTDIVRSHHHGARDDSHFWLFFESRTPQHRRRQWLVLLGGMNIPRRARERFESVDFITRFKRALPRPIV
ncbi:uncharacterized protein UTRI_10396 [Ustilago trichophora]|uniref:Effector family protein Eff1 n=1 Tax=Ustilago trichophora TaxID=86804 RepID=A0A5C3EDP0_9BASI|nr:uncharacterized protein UTRI_10396 [Ustilago trichophora]